MPDKLRHPILALILIISTALKAQVLSEKSFEPDYRNFANPERGLYHHTEVHSGSYVLLNTEQLAAYRTQESITQILRVFYLEDFRRAPISESYLDNMRRDFSAIRSAGIKCIVRFAYTTSSSSPYNDALPEVVQMHITQLTPVLRENADVIAVMQAGFIGAWGEWYYTDHFSVAPGNVTSENWADRKAVVTGILKALPPDRMIQVRTPGYKMALFDSEVPLNETSSFTGTDISRVGHHNDCFVASSSDYGTYVNPEVEKPYLEQETLYLPMGGETCGLASPYSDCDNSLSELQQFHWSYLNVDYHQSVLNEWDQQGCYDEIVKNLGYRHRLLTAVYTPTSRPDGLFQLTLSMINEGYANFYNPRNLYVILKHLETGEEYIVQSATDTRRWPVGEAHEVTIEAGIPENTPPGDYSVLLSLPDPYKTLQSPAYAVRLGNEDTWISELGYNDLGITLHLSATSETPVYTGELYFRPAQWQPTLNPSGFGTIRGRSDEKSIALYWPTFTDTYQRILERSTDDSDFIPIAAINTQTFSFEDLNVSKGHEYHYRCYLLSENERSGYSDTITLAVRENDSVNMMTDGDDADWGALTPLIHTADTEFSTVTVHFGISDAFLILENASTYHIYLDADNNSATGWSDSAAPNNGADYLLSDGWLYRHENEAWITVNSLESAGAYERLELSLPLSDLPLTDGMNLVKFSGSINGNELSNGLQNAPTMVRLLPPDTPASLTVGSDLLTDNSLALQWTECQYCQGYLIERSATSDLKFEIVKTITDPEIIEWRDFNLANGVTHYYRMASYNDLGQSSYTETIHGIPELLLTTDESSDELILYPNPTSGVIGFSEHVLQVSLANMEGKVLLTADHPREIYIDHLPAGIYVLTVQLTTHMVRQRVIKQ